MIAGAGFAVMAWREAQRRTGWFPLKRTPLCREATAYNFLGSVDGEYYRILDRVEHELWHISCCDYCQRNEECRTVTP